MSNKKESAATEAKTSDTKDDKYIKNGPNPTEGIQFENKNLLIYYKR